MDSVINLVGVVSLLLVFVAYGLMQARKIAPTDMSYLLMNLLGSTGLMATLTVDWNLGGFIINAFWMAISLYGLFKHVAIKP